MPNESPPEGPPSICIVTFLSSHLPSTLRPAGRWVMLNSGEGAALYQHVKDEGRLTPNRCSTRRNSPESGQSISRPIAGGVCVNDSSKAAISAGLVIAWYDPFAIQLARSSTAPLRSPTRQRAAYQARLAALFLKYAAALGRTLIRPRCLGGGRSRLRTSV